MRVRTCACVCVSERERERERSVYVCAHHVQFAGVLEKQYEYFKSFLNLRIPTTQSFTYSLNMNARTHARKTLISAATKFATHAGTPS